MRVSTSNDYDQQGGMDISMPPTMPMTSRTSPARPNNNPADNSMFMEQPMRRSTDGVDMGEMGERARNIYGGTMGGSGGGGGGGGGGVGHPLSNSMPSWGYGAQGGNMQMMQPPPMPSQPTSPSTAWADVPLPTVGDGNNENSNNMNFARDSLEMGGGGVVGQQGGINKEEDEVELNRPPPLPSGDELGSSHALTASEKHSIQEEKRAAAKHMRDLNMLLAGTLDPRDVEFVFTEPEESQLDGEADGMGRRNMSTGSLQSRRGKERVERQEQKDLLKQEHDRALVERTLGILEKHKTRGLQKAINKWKIEVRAMNMSRAEKARLQSIEEGQRKKDEEMEERLKKQSNENKQRSAIQLMLDAKKKGKQLMVLAGWNTWKQFVVSFKKEQFNRAMREKDNGHGVMRIAKMISSNKQRQIFKAWCRWKGFVMSEVKRGGGEDRREGERIKGKMEGMKRRTKELEIGNREMREELER